MISGRCECGKVAFKVDEIRKSVTVCHCGQCRRTSGHLWASTYAQSYAQIEFSDQAGLSWYASSQMAKRGFCRFCGSSLFYSLNREQGVGIAAGCLSSPTGLAVQKHIFVDDKGDYYDIGDELPQVSN